jgi:hypothetical protein
MESFLGGLFPGGYDIVSWGFGKCFWVVGES